MEIVKFKKSKSNLYEIMLDNGLSFKLYDDVIVKYNLLVNKKFDDKFFEDVRNYNDSLDAYYLSIKYLNTKMRSEKELKKYLAKKNIFQEHIESTIKRLNSEVDVFILGNHEHYIIEGSQIDKDMSLNEICHHDWLIKTLNKQDINILSSNNNSYELIINNKNSYLS